MGKATKFFRSLLGSKKSPPESSSSAAAVPSKEKKKKKTKCALSESADFSNFKNVDPLASPCVDGMDANKHAIAVAAATAAVAEAALAAAQAAAEVVRLTSGGERNVPAYISHDRRRVAAAVIIQSAFRAYLARRALRALKGLVKLQALVRGHIVRKLSADMLRRMQAMARIQARASATRSHYSINYRHPSGAAKPRNSHPWSDNGGHMMMQPRSGSRETSKWLSHWMEQYSSRSDKILEIDTWKPRRSDRAFSGGLQRNEKRNPSVSSEADQVGVWTAESSPRVHSASSRPTSNARGVFTPTRSECSRSWLGDYLSHPSYMANTESSRAKARSQSAPKQRMMQLDENAWESDAVSYLKRQGTHTRGATNNTLSYGYRL